MWWPRLDSELRKIRSTTQSEPSQSLTEEKSVAQVLEVLLASVRSQERSLLRVEANLSDSKSLGSKSIRPMAVAHLNEFALILRRVLDETLDGDTFRYAVVPSVDGTEMIDLGILRELDERAVKKLIHGLADTPVPISIRGPNLTTVIRPREEPASDL